MLKLARSFPCRDSGLSRSQRVNDLHPLSHSAHAKERDQASSGRHDRQEDLIAVCSATVGWLAGRSVHAL